jgi:hypothetical protein
MEKTITHYEIIDNQTKAVVGKAKTRKSASKSVDRRDNAYGAYRYSARAVYAAKPANDWQDATIEELDEALGDYSEHPELAWNGE